MLRPAFAATRAWLGARAPFTEVVVLVVIIVISKQAVAITLHFERGSNTSNEASAPIYHDYVGQRRWRYSSRANVHVSLTLSGFLSRCMPRFSRGQKRARNTRNINRLIPFCVATQMKYAVLSMTGPTFRAQIENQTAYHRKQRPSGNRKHRQ